MNCIASITGLVMRRAASVLCGQAGGPCGVAPARASIILCAVLVLVFTGAVAQPPPATSAADAEASAPSTADYATVTDAVIARTKALAKSDPTAAVRYTMPYWQGGPLTPERIQLGDQLMAAAQATGQFKRVIAIAERLDKASLSPRTRQSVVSYLAAHISDTTHDIAKIKTVETQVAALRGTTPAQREDIADIWRSLAASYFWAHDIKDAERIGRIALAKVPKRPDIVEFQAEQLIAIGYAERDDSAQALQWLMKADAVGKALRVPDKYESVLMDNLMGVSIQLKHYRQAIAYGERALAAHPPPTIKLDVLDNLGDAYAETNVVGKAIGLYRQALALARKIHAPQGPVLTAWGEMLQKRNQPAMALSMFQTAIAAYKRDNDASGLAIAHSNLGQTLVALGRREAAATAFAQSLAEFRKGDAVPQQLELYPRMVANLAALGRYKDALALMQAFKQLSDRHINVQSQTEVAKLEATIEVDRQKAELAEAARQRAAQTADLAKLHASALDERRLLYGLVVVLMLLALIVAIKVRESRMRRRLNLELKHKNAVIETRHAELSKLNAIVQRQSEEDALTGLRNRRYG